MKHLPILILLSLITLFSCSKEEGSVYDGDYTLSGYKYDAYAEYSPTSPEYLKIDTIKITDQEFTIKKEGETLIISSTELTDTLSYDFITVTGDKLRYFENRDPENWDYYLTTNLTYELTKVGEKLTFYHYDYYANSLGIPDYSKLELSN